MNNATARKRTQITIGLDLGDRRHTYYVLDGAGKMAREGSLGNTRQQLATMARSYPGATVVMEAGTHSPWVSRFLQELGLRVIVANARKTRAIYQNERKSDRRDAMMLARLARMDPTLLHSIEHGSQEVQQGYAPTQVARHSWRRQYTSTRDLDIDAVRHAKYFFC